MLEMLKARKEELQAQGKKGFTLMEMLIVIAIIAILIAIAIPVLQGQLENAREATDAANLRSAYATASVKALEDNTDVYAGPVEITQTGAWASMDEGQTVGGVPFTGTGAIPQSGPLYVHVSSTGSVEIVDALPSGKTAVSPVTGQ